MLQTPLYLAAQKGLQSVAEKLVTIPDSKIIMNGTKLSAIPIHAAVSNSNNGVLLILIKAGCNINIVSVMLNTCDLQVDIFEKTFEFKYIPWKLV